MGASTTSSVSTGTVTICNAPAASTVRNIDSITIYNADTVASEINITFLDTATNYRLTNVTLQSGETSQYTHGRGWETTDINGALKSSLISQYATNLTGTPTLPNGTAAITQVAYTDSNLVATTAYVDGAISTYSFSHTTIYNVTVDLGTRPTFNGQFTISGNAFTSGSAVNIWQASTRPNSALYDSIQFDQIMISAIVINSTTIQCNWGCQTAVVNSYTFNYRF
jgi:hypothetical protein